MKASKFQVMGKYNGELNLMLTVTDYNMDNLAKLVDLSNNGKILDVSIKKEVKHRTKEANAYMWELLSQLARVLSTSKEELYQKYIRDYGIFNLVLVEDKAVDDYIRHWNGSGLGNFASVKCKSDLNKDCSIVESYFGSSSYNTYEMSAVIEQVVIDCEEQGIPTMTQNEIDRMLGRLSNGKEKTKPKADS